MLYHLYLLLEQSSVAQLKTLPNSTNAISNALLSLPPLYLTLTCPAIFTCFTLARAMLIFKQYQLHPTPFLMVHTVNLVPLVSSITCNGCENESDLTCYPIGQQHKAVLGSVCKEFLWIALLLGLHFWCYIAGATLHWLCYFAGVSLYWLCYFADVSLHWLCYISAATFYWLCYISDATFYWLCYISGAILHWLCYILVRSTESTTCQPPLSCNPHTSKIWPAGCSKANSSHNTNLAKSKVWTEEEVYWWQF